MNCKAYGILSISILGNIIAFFGFQMILQGADKAGYYDVLTALSLLATGAFAAFPAVEYRLAERDETILITIISALFAILFYLLFSLICFCLGQSVSVIPYSQWTIPLVMLLLLALISVIDFWDYRAPKCSNAGRGKNSPLNGPFLK